MNLKEYVSPRLNLPFIALNTKVICILSQWLNKNHLDHLVIYLVILLKTDITIKGVLQVSNL